MTKRRRRIGPAWAVPLIKRAVWMLPSCAVYWCVVRMVTETNLEPSWSVNTMVRLWLEGEVLR